MYHPTLVTQALSQGRGSMPVFRQERELMQVAASQRWSFRVVGVAPVPETPVYYKEAWLVPLSQDRSAIPPEGRERMRAIAAAGIRPKAYVIVHEARKELTAPAGTPQMTPLAFWTKRIARYSLAAAQVTGSVLAAAVTILAPLILAGTGLFVMAMVGFLGGIDPILVAVTNENVWIEVYRWRV